MTELPRDLLVAERQFLVASVTVWEEIDQREAMPGGYSAQPLTKDKEIRIAERAAWSTYRNSMEAYELMICPRCEGQAYDRGSCSLCDNTGYTTTALAPQPRPTQQELEQERERSLDSFGTHHEFLRAAVSEGGRMSRRYDPDWSLKLAFIAVLWFGLVALGSWFFWNAVIT